jgi:hypothetical protein
LLGILNCGTVIADVAYLVTIGILLARVAHFGAVIFIAAHGITIIVIERIEGANITLVADSIAITVSLIGVGMIRAVVTSVTESVTIVIDLIGIEYFRAIVFVVDDPVIIEITIVVEDGAVVTHGKDVSSGSPPDTPELSCRATGHGRPGCSVVMEDGAIETHGKDVSAGTSPDTKEGFCPSIAHG